MGQEGRDHPREAYPGARLEPPQPARHGHAAPRSRLRRLAERVREGRRLGPRTARALDGDGALPMPSPAVHGGALHGAAEALQQAGKDASREAGPGVTVGRRREPHPRQMGPMAAGGGALEPLQPEEGHSRDRRAPAVAPPGLADLATSRENRVGWPPRGPLAGDASPESGETWDHGVTSCTMGC
jgi:hypothetical protein